MSQIKTLAELDHVLGESLDKLSGFFVRHAQAGLYRLSLIR